MQLIWAPTIIISPTQPVAIGQPRQLQVSLKLTVCFAFSGFLRILIGILHQTNFYCLNLIFWILFMGCGKARFGQRGLKPRLLEHLVSKFVARGSRGGATGLRGRCTWESLEVPGGAHRNPWQQILRQKCSSLRGFFAPPTKTSYATPQSDIYCPTQPVWEEMKNLRGNLRRNNSE